MAGDPAVDAAAIVADLEARALRGFHQVQVLGAVNLAEDDVPDLHRRRVDWRDGAQLPRFNLASHRMAAGPERNRLACSQLRNMTCRPTHNGQS